MGGGGGSVRGDGVLDCGLHLGDVVGAWEGDLRSDVGVVAASETEAPSFADVLADACWARGRGVPLLPSSITCRMV